MSGYRNIDTFMIRDRDTRRGTDRCIDKEKEKQMHVQIFKEINGVVESQKLDTLKIDSIYNYEKITTLFKNFDTMSFLELLLNYKNLKDNGYDKHFLNQKSIAPSLQ